MPTATLNALATLLATASCAAAATTGLLITEIVDGTLPGGTPRFIELTNTSATTIDFTNLSVGLFKNGRTTLDATIPLAGSLPAGQTYVIAYDDDPYTGNFFDTYGFNPTLATPDLEINGDDTLVLYDGIAAGDGSNATTLDIYGQLGVDGTGDPWEYTDSFAYRRTTITNANPDFTLSEWVFGTPNALEADTDEQNLTLILANTTPGNFTGTDPGNPVPTPAAAAAGLLLLATLTLRRSA
ncbi:lamin tail domain-containing protein [Mucisphaera calidilacus]|uniref:LTD domain-containing protein n=1 Tax=Mucisphaera calidilacus TaxID=2527982 RepID=A0A518C0W8_9BACT|nr:lamin tail domain-containing protein [Mucisphaera calidilacus]QDU72877.1 hypothetical protein Pan265_27530 [Mucisphaera calidilacus]